MTTDRLFTVAELAAVPEHSWQAARVVVLLAAIASGRSVRRRWLPEVLP